jgi:copper chaperone CopZ
VTVAVIPVEGMHCAGCERALRTALEALPGVERARPEHIGDDVEVVYDDRVTSMAELRAAVAAAGFTAR